MDNYAFLTYNAIVSNVKKAQPFSSIPPGEEGWPIDTRFPSGRLGLFFDEKVQQLIDSFAYCFKVKITIFSARMEELVVGLQNPGSSYCQLIQNKLRLRYRCCHQDTKMCKLCCERDDLIIYECYAGPYEAVLPIKIEEKLVGYGLLGQFRSRPDTPEEMLRIWKKAGFDQKELQTAFNEQPFFDKSALDNMLRLFSMLISFIVSHEHIRLRHPGVAEQVNHWLDDHLAEPLTLEDAASAVQRSCSTISHTIKSQLGMTFNQLCILKRIQRFESVIAADPELSIKEAVFMTGYTDPLYFSRIYKKVGHTAPSNYVNGIRKQST
jgi:AraC-like DNA-binding protein/ligand-binding sensor protein